MASADEPGPLSPEARALLRDAVVAATEGREGVRAKNLDALEKFAGVRWPRVAGLPWFHVALTDGRAVGAWRIGDEESTTFMAIDFRAVTLERKDIEKTEPAGFREDVKKLIRLCGERDEEAKRSWDFTFVQRRGFRLGLAGRSGVPRLAGRGGQVIDTHLRTGRTAGGDR